MENGENKPVENGENKPVESSGGSSENKPSFDFESWVKEINSRLDRMEASKNQPIEQTKNEPVKTEVPIVTNAPTPAVELDSDFDNYCKIHFDHKEIK